jgi:hypothetical protein
MSENQNTTARRGRTKRAVNYDNVAAMTSLLNSVRKDMEANPSSMRSWESDFNTVCWFLDEIEPFENPLQRAYRLEYELIQHGEFDRKDTLELMDASEDNAAVVNPIIEQLQEVHRDANRNHEFYDAMREVLLLVPEKIWTRHLARARKKRHNQATYPTKTKMDVPRGISREISELKDEVGLTTNAECITEMIRRSAGKRHRIRAMKIINRHLSHSFNHYAFFIQNHPSQPGQTILDVLMNSDDPYDLSEIVRWATKHRKV